MISANKISKRLMAMAGLLLGLGQQAVAQSIDYTTATPADTPVTNTATVDFTVGSVTQSTTSNTYVFQVDRVVELTLMEDSGIQQITTPGASGSVTKYTLTNNSNDVLDFVLVPSNVTNLTSLGGSLGTDSGDADSFQIFLDSTTSGTSGSYDPADDTSSGPIDNLAPGDSVTIFVLANIPSGATAGQIIGVELTATAQDENGNNLTESATNTDNLETVFGGSVTANASGNPTISDYGSYLVTDADISVNKYSTVIDDYVSTSPTEPKAIPGALVEYCMEITNGGTAAATNVVLTDSIPANTSYVASSLMGGSEGPGGEVCDATYADGSLTTDDSSGVSVTFPSVPDGETVWVSFQVTID